MGQVGQVMSLQVFWSLLQSYPNQVVNGLALFFAVAGSWLWLATQWREYQADRLQALVESRGLVYMADGDKQRLNRFFYGFGAVSLALGLDLSVLSTYL